MDANIKQIKLQDKCRDFKWVSEKFQQKKLFIGGRMLNNDTFNAFRKLVKVTEEVYSGLWDIELRDASEDVLDISAVIIYFPEILITNSSGESHTIKDLFIRLRIGIYGENLKIEDIQGGRTTLSYKEFCSNYFHSHLPGRVPSPLTNQVPYYTSFCKGSGHINEYLANLNAEGISEETLIPFLVQILGLLSWESIEGGPHRRICNLRINIVSGRISRPTERDSIELLSLALAQHRDKGILPNIDFKLVGDKYSLIENEKIENFLTKETTLSEIHKKNYLCMEDSEGNYYNYGSTPGFTQVPNTAGRTYIFQGREIPFIIEPSPETAKQEEIKYFLHPTIKRNITEKINKNVNKNKIRKSTVERYSNRSDSTSESTRPNKVVV